MATTGIHAITGTVGQAISYIISDKVELLTKDDIADSINYAMNDKTGEVVYHTLTTTQNCNNVNRPVEDFYKMMKLHGEEEILHGNAKTKDGKPVLAWHLIQSFEGIVDPRIANEIGRKMAAELFGNFPVVISTHTNTENTHNHLIVCAWNRNGEKWNQCNDNYRWIRETSDKYCDEYGLSVLEHTRKQKLIPWKDEDGNTHYYEPTDRKNELIKKREAGEISSDDVGSYRNTVPYEVTEQKKQSNVEIVRQAIDNLLPHATSYEHLLQMMREQGFEVKDKKKNGDWLAHVTFTPPTADKGVRDSSIDKDTGFYTRENLTRVIADSNAEHDVEVQPEQPKVPYFESYEYGKIDVQSINENYRAKKNPSGEIEIVSRGEAERSVIRDIKHSDFDLRKKYDTSTLDKLIAEQKVAKKNNVSPKTRSEVLVRQIQDGFENLKFIEQKHLYSYQQINDIVKGLWGQYNACLSKIVEAEAMVERLDYASKTPQMLNEVRKRMESGRNNPEYMMEQYHEDIKVAKACMDSMKRYGITDAASLKELQEKIEKYREQIGKLQSMLDSFSGELYAYNRCVSVLSRIERESGGGFGEQLDAYNHIVREAEQEASKSEEKRKKKGAFDR